MDVEYSDSALSDGQEVMLLLLLMMMMMINFIY